MVKDTIRHQLYLQDEEHPLPGDLFRHIRIPPTHNPIRRIYYSLYYYKNFFVVYIQMDQANISFRTFNVARSTIGATAQTG